jgi:hypothetical protein
MTKAQLSVEVIFIEDGEQSFPIKVESYLSGLSEAEYAELRARVTRSRRTPDPFLLCGDCRASIFTREEVLATPLRRPEGYCGFVDCGIFFISNGICSLMRMFSIASNLRATARMMVLFAFPAAFIFTMNGRKRRRWAIIERAAI